MKADDANLLDLLKVTVQFEVPIYQRSYAWGAPECDQLWRDILRAGLDDDLQAHFTGSVVYVEKAAGTQTSQPAHLIIDGQQRVTTVSLILAVLARRLEAMPEGEQEPIEGFSPVEIRESYLVNKHKSDERRFKLLLSAGDREALKSVVDGQEPHSDARSRIYDNLSFFEERISDSKLDLAVVCRGLAKLQVVDVKLELGVDKPQLVFEAMNSTGKRLSQADLIRNFVLMDLHADEQARLWRYFWRPMEVTLEPNGAEGVFDNFVRHYLTAVTGNIPRLDDIHEAFKDHAARRKLEGESIESLVSELRDYAARYAAIALGQEPDPSLHPAFEELAQIRADVVYPFLLSVYTDRDFGIISSHEMLHIVRLVVSYIVRRAVAGYATNSLNTTFQTFGRALRKDRYVESVEAHFLRLQGYRVFPADAEFEEKLKTFDAYHFKRRSYFFRSLENFGRKEPVATDEYTIEHILPQNENLRREWRDALGTEWREIQQRYLHTLGNLTLTGYNSEYSDRSFREKRDMVGGFRESPLRLNEQLRTLEGWNAETIERRAESLARRALDVWVRPKLPADVLTAYDEPRRVDEYTIEDHPNLLREERREQFEWLRGEILALDPSVLVVFKKLQVAFRAESTFLDVIPQAARLLLVLNIPIGALRDERGLARDVSQIGHWGSGDTELPLGPDADRHYLMGLIRQAYEYQLGES